MAAVGFDVGNLTCYIGVARAGGIETIANEYSDRCTPTFVSLNERNRCIGVSARNQCITNYKNTVSCFKRLTGRRFKDPQVQHEINAYRVPFKVIEGLGGDAFIEVEYMKQIHQFRPEQIMAMILTKLKETSQVALHTKVVDVVVSVPVFFTDVERRAMLNACQVAGLNCLKLMNDTTAVALAYGIYKQDLPAETEKPRNVIFVDAGYSSIQVCAVSFNKGKLKVNSVAFDANLGGRDFDQVLVDYFVEEFLTKFKLDVQTNLKAYIRLTQECEKLKKLISTNSNKIPLNIECFMDDKDVNGMMDRITFEELSASLLKRVEKLFVQIKEQSKLTPDEIYSVEIIGGSSRIPALKDLVTKVFGKEPSTTLNADEAIARGCALQSAILCPTFRVRDFSITECQPYPITLSWGAEIGNEDSMEVFPLFHAIPMSKMLTFYRKEGFTLEVQYRDPQNVPIPNPHIGTFTIKNITPQANGESSKVKVKVRVNNHGIFTVQSASMLEKQEEKEEAMETDQNNKEEKQELVSDDSSTNQKADGANQTEGKMETDQPEGQSTSEQTAETQKSEEKSQNMEDNKGEKENDDKKDKKKKKKNGVKSIDLPIESIVPQLEQQKIHDLLEKENKMIMQDKLEKEKNDAKNSVEEYVYDMREKLYGIYELFCKEEERDKFSKLLGDTENWLYGEGDDQGKQVYLDKLAELKKCGQMISDRCSEFERRPQAFDELGSALQQVYKFLDLWEKKDEKYSHIEKDDFDKVQKCWKEKSDWYEKQINAVQKMNTYDDPIVLVSQIQQQKQSLEYVCNPIINKPKPKPKEDPPKNDKKTKESASEDPKDAGNTNKNAKDENKNEKDLKGPTIEEAQQQNQQKTEMEVE
ncbi:hypothetical protein CHS0354_010679 [Potamilus streckersoni]|uniref:Uncharacterized protein n=1 Tax=Potamilus streckersoni TaxID=2493646 RepID=A0AAE0TCZ8_9BIVA|nr:hypothetical protein CHS0354_010679 [Potamilus streckersoni]